MGPCDNSWRVCERRSPPCRPPASARSCKRYEVPQGNRAAACGDTLQKKGKNKPRGKPPKVPRSPTPAFVYKPGRKIAEVKSSETLCAKKVSIAVGHVIHAPERVGVVGAELGLLERQRLFVELEGRGVPAEVSVVVGQ